MRIQQIIDFRLTPEEAEMNTAIVALFIKLRMIFEVMRFGMFQNKPTLLQQQFVVEYKVR